MTISSWLMSLSKRKNDRDSRTAMLIHAVDVISGYGEVLEHTSSSGKMKYPISMLPFSKSEILEAIKLLHSCKDNLADKKRLLTFLDKQQVEIMLTSKFSEQMSASTIFLNDFIDDDIAKRENAEWDEIYKRAIT